MGNKKQYLVVMTNNDAYHVDDIEGRALASILESNTPAPLVSLTDLKLKAAVAVATRHISSVVELKGRSNGS